MSYGLQLFNANGDLCLDTGDTLPRRIATYSAAAAVPITVAFNTTWSNPITINAPEIIGLAEGSYFIVLGSQVIENKREHQSNNITDQTIITGYVQNMPPSYITSVNNVTGNIVVAAMVSVIIYDQMPFGSQMGNWWLLHKTHYVTLQIYRY